MVNKNRNLKKQSHSRYSLKKGKRPAGLHSQYVVISADKNAEKKVDIKPIVHKETDFIPREEKKKPLIMARLLNVESLLSSMVCKEEMDLEFVLYDPIIRENNCLFILKGNEELEKIEEEEKEIFSAEFKEEISKLMPFSPVFINEIV